MEHLRHVLLRLVLVLVAPPLLCALAESPALATVHVTHGPMVGAVSYRSAIVWVRLDTVATVRVEYGTDPALEPPLPLSPAVTTSPDSDYTAFLYLNPSNPTLSAGTTYYYRVVVNGVSTDLTGEFTTFPLTTSTANFSFVVYADIADTYRQQDKHGYAYTRLTQVLTPAFVLQIGDFDHSDPDSASNNGAGWLPNMRAMHQHARDASLAHGGDWQSSIASKYPVFHMWDNHDYGASDRTFTIQQPKCDGTTSVDSTKFTSYPLGRSAAWRAFLDYWPMPPLPNPPARASNYPSPADTTVGLWHKFSFGKADFFMLDCRSEKNLVSSTTVGDTAVGTMLGRVQVDWLKTELTASKDNGASWIFLISPVSFDSTAKRASQPFLRKNLNTGRGSWGAYYHERNELAEFIASLNLTNVVWITGDLHSGGAMDSTHTGYTKSGTGHLGAPEFGVPSTNIYTEPTSGCACDPDQAETAFTRNNACTLQNNYTGSWTPGVGASTTSYLSGKVSVPTPYPYLAAGPGFARFDVTSTQVRVRFYQVADSPTATPGITNYATGKPMDFTVTK